MKYENVCCFIGCGNCILDHQWGHKLCLGKGPICILRKDNGLLPHFCWDYRQNICTCDALISVLITGRGEKPFWCRMNKQWAGLMTHFFVNSESQNICKLLLPFLFFFSNFCFIIKFGYYFTVDAVFLIFFYQIKCYCSNRGCNHNVEWKSFQSSFQIHWHIWHLSYISHLCYYLTLFHLITRWVSDLSDLL